MDVMAEDDREHPRADRPEIIRRTSRTQRTDEGFEIPIPSEEGFKDTLKKVSRKTAKPKVGS